MPLSRVQVLPGLSFFASVRLRAACVGSNGSGCQSDSPLATGLLAMWDNLRLMPPFRQSDARFNGWMIVARWVDWHYGRHR